MAARTCVGLADDVEPGDLRAPGVGLQQGAQDPDDGGLAGAVGPEQPEDGALGDGEVDPAERGGLPEALDEPLDDDRRWSCRAR